jgi:hypothetical protein
VSADDVQKYKNDRITREDVEKVLHGQIDASGEKGRHGENVLTIKNADSGATSKLSRSSVGKLTSNAAINESIRNGFTRGEHLAAVSDIVNLYRNSIRVGSHPDKNNSPDILAINRYAAPTYEDNIAYITEKVTTSGEKIYSLELMGVRGLGDRIKKINSKVPMPSQPTDNKIINNFENVNTPLNKKLADDNPDIPDLTEALRDIAFDSLFDGISAHEAEARYWGGDYDLPDLRLESLNNISKMARFKVSETKAGYKRWAVTNGGVQFIIRMDDGSGANEWIVEGPGGRGATLPEDAKIWIDTANASERVKNKFRKMGVDARGGVRADGDHAKEEAARMREELERERAEREEERSQNKWAAERAKRDEDRKAKREERERKMELDLKAARAVARKHRYMNAVKNGRAPTMDAEHHQMILDLFKAVGASSAIYEQVEKLLAFFQAMGKLRFKNNPDAEIRDRSFKIADNGDKYDWIKVSAKEISDWIESNDAVPEFLTRVQEQALSSVFRKMSARQVKDFLLELSVIEKQGRESWETHKMAEALKHRVAVDDLLSAGGAGGDADYDALLQNHEEKIVGPAKAEAKDAAKFAKLFGIEVMRPSTICRLLDRAKEGGPWLTRVHDRMLDAVKERMRLNKKSAAMTDKIFAEHKIDVKTLADLVAGKDGRPAGFYKGDKPVNWTIDEAMAIYAHSKNEDNLRHLEASGIHYANEKKGREDTLTPIINALPQKYKDAVDDFMAELERRWEDINPVFVREHQIDMPKISGYFPLARLERDRQHSSEDLMAAEFGTPEMQKKGIEKGFTRTRSGAANKFEDLSFLDTLIPHLQHTDNYIAMTDASREVRKLLDRKSVV